MPQIAIVMAIHTPDHSFLREQVQSLASQTVTDFEVIFVIADNASADLITHIAEDAYIPYKIVDPKTHLNPVQGFENGLRAAIETDAEYVACCDQDDIWREDRLALGIEILSAPDIMMCHSDARIVDKAGVQISPSLFRREHRQRHPKLTDLLYRNTVTGMTILAKREVVTAALPFPEQDGVHYYHDLWLALVAMTKGQLSFIDQTLVDYRQHDRNVVGARTQKRAKSFRARTAEYALARYLAETLVGRFGSNTQLTLFVKSQTWGWAHICDFIRFLMTGHVVQAYIAFWFTIIPWGRRLWTIRHLWRNNYRPSLGEFDNRLFTLSPGRHPPDLQTHHPARPWWEYRDGRMSPKFIALATRPAPRMVIFVPTLNPAEAFAGIATALDFGLGLAERGHPVSFIATDLPMIDANKTRAFLATRNIIADDNALVHLQCGVSEKQIEFHIEDRFVATAWWTAHLAQTVASDVGVKQPFYYLIQDYEPCFYPWGTEFAYAQASYAIPHIPLFNSVPLRDFFAREGLCATNALCFRPSIDLAAYTPRQSTTGPRRLVIYGRPEVARNLFPMKIAALGSWLQQRNLTGDDIECISIGMKHADIEMPGGITLNSLGKLPWADYPNYLGSVDVGLSLMCSPHPSHPPIEMAAAGVQVVTNDFASKSLSNLSPNIHTTCLSVPDIVKGLDRAWDAANSPQFGQVDLSTLGPPMENVLDLIQVPPTREDWAA